MHEEDSTLLQSIDPVLQPIIRSLSDPELLRQIAALVDFVIYATNEDLLDVLALVDGLASTHAMDPPTLRLISISGTRSLIDPSGPVAGKTKGNAKP
jgi:hypothetical protein